MTDRHLRVYLGDMENRIREIADTVGGPKALADKLGIRHSALYKWTRVPAERIVDIERITGIPRQRLRPDLYEGMADTTTQGTPT